MVVDLALELAARGWAVFPCGDDKRPVRPKSEGGNGFHDASRNPDRIRHLWRRWPGPLVGIATGPASGIAVLDIDAKHPCALDWLARHEAMLGVPWRLQTRSGGWHLYYGNVAGVRCTAGRPIAGVDVRGWGGYVIFWGAAPPDQLWLRPFPKWLITEVWPPKKLVQRNPLGDVPAVVWLPALLRAVERAGEGTRNNVLYWAACRCRERIEAGEFTRQEALRWLFASASFAGLPPSEIWATLNSALGT